MALILNPLTRDYLIAAREAGCPEDQALNFLRAGLVLQPQQLRASAAARLADQEPGGPTAIGYGGARGGGKSFWMLAQIGADDCQRYPGLKCLLLRKVGKSNTEHLEDLRRRVFRGLPHRLTSRGILIFDNGSRVITSHYQCEKEIDRYLGLEYDVIAIEESTTLTKRKFEDIRTCLRTSKPGWRPRMYLTTNPGGVGHVWFRQLFIAPFRAQAETDTRFIPAKCSDNRFNNPGYQRTLAQLCGWQKRAWLEGDWDIAAGQFFTHFRHELHVRADLDPALGREWFGALDYGFTHYTVFLLACKDGDGNFYIVDEHARRQWLPESHARAIRELLARHRQLLENRCGRRAAQALELEKLRIFAGADCFSRQSDGRTIAQQYRDLGLRLSPANTDRVNGWAEILRRLGDPSAGIPPRIWIHQRCQRLIECLPALQHDPNHPEDIIKVDIDDDGAGGDDPADAVRYLVATKPRVVHVCKLTGF